MGKFDQSHISTIVRRAVVDCLAANRPSRGIPEDPFQLFTSPESNALKEEILSVGRKLWARQYVDGNGGNISVRVSSQYVLCTPTLCSKADLRVEDISLVDFQNRQICGERPQTSEILLHLEIYKAVPEAKAVIHCHPPYATAYAVAGVIPQGNLIPEQEVFVGPVALAPYETPGTPAFARTILPYVKDHNTILLANHGVACWADTATHAEWYVEVVDTYCKTLLIASQLGHKLNEIPPEKITDLLAIKKKLGLPDPRIAADCLTDRDCSIDGKCSTDGADGSAHSSKPEGEDLIKRVPNKNEIDEFVNRLTSEVSTFLNRPS